MPRALPHTATHCCALPHSVSLCALPCVTNVSLCALFITLKTCHSVHCLVLQMCHSVHCPVLQTCHFVHSVMGDDAAVRWTGSTNRYTTVLNGNIQILYMFRETPAPGRESRFSVSYGRVGRIAKNKQPNLAKRAYYHLWLRGVKDTPCRPTACVVSNAIDHPSKGHLLFLVLRCTVGYVRDYSHKETTA
jgi:hypothetical protein